MESLVKTVLRTLVRTLEDNDTKKSDCTVDGKFYCENSGDKYCFDNYMQNCMNKSHPKHDRPDRYRGDEKRKVEDDKEDNKNPQVFYYCTVPQRDRNALALIGVVGWSDVGDNYYYDNSKLANSEGKLLDKQHIYYRGMKAEGLNENPDSFWESLTIITSSDDQIIAEANYSQDASLTSEVATESDQETFLVTGASGKFEGAKKIVVEYDNDLTKPWTPDLIKNHKSKDIKFRRVTVYH